MCFPFQSSIWKRQSSGGRTLTLPAKPNRHKVRVATLLSCQIEYASRGLGGWSGDTTAMVFLKRSLAVWLLPGADRERKRLAGSQPRICAIEGSGGRLLSYTMSESLVINEIYLSLQGESTFAGLPCIFVRLTACDLRCSYCDTAYAFTVGKKATIPKIL